MKISTKGIYALEIVTDLAQYSGENQLESLKNIAKRRNLSEKYLERIVKRLKESDIITSVRGAYGGYRLTNDASIVTAYQVLLAVEGELAPVACLTKKTDCGIDCDACPTRNTWERLWFKILGITKEVTIADIIGEVNELQKSNKK
ncbi:MAG: Rrf2 family transcriptional regulator [Lachnospiraceae bacterium]|nr:Rrf2 family transcriptional regulator [Lachnospiraceae bacterium]